MQKLKDIMKVAALASVPVVAACVCLLLLQVSTAVKECGAVTKQASATINHVDGMVEHLDWWIHTGGTVAVDTVTHIDQTLNATTKTVGSVGETSRNLSDAIALTSHRVNDLCPDAKAVDAALHPCGTLADVNRTLATVRGTSGQVESSLRMFNAHEADLFVQEQASYAAMSKSVQDFEKLVSDPELMGTIANVRTITGDTAAMTTDGRSWLHAKLYPTKKKGFISGFEATGDVAKHWMPSLF